MFVELSSRGMKPFAAVMSCVKTCFVSTLCLRRHRFLLLASPVVKLGCWDVFDSMKDFCLD
jgi:hypothetical protein